MVSLWPGHRLNRKGPPSIRGFEAGRFQAHRPSLARLHILRPSIFSSRLSERWIFSSFLARQRNTCRLERLGLTRVRRNVRLIKRRITGEIWRGWCGQVCVYFLVWLDAAVFLTFRLGYLTLFFLFNFFASSVLSINMSTAWEYEYKMHRKRKWYRPVDIIITSQKVRGSKGDWAGIWEIETTTTTTKGRRERMETSENKRRSINKGKINKGEEKISDSIVDGEGGKEKFIFS